MKVGILACGNIARKMANTINQMDGVTCVAAASRSLEKAKEFAEKYGISKAYGSYEALAQDPEVELVYIASPHSHHYEHAMLCLEHGKSILCEKAFMANAKQAEKVINLGKEKNLLVAEAIWTRYLPSRKMIDDIIARGEIGEVTSVTANLGYKINHVPRIYNPELAGGALLDVGVYPINFASMVLGNDIQEIISSCILTDEGVDEQNAMIFKYRNGKMASLHSNALSGTDQTGMVFGTTGYLVAEGVNNVSKIKVYDIDRRLQKEYEVPPQLTGFEYEVESCKKALEEGRIECEEMPHEEILAIMKVMDHLREQWGMSYPFE